jgi:hypothetical protein
MKSNLLKFLKIRVTKIVLLFLVIKRDLKVIAHKRLIINKTLQIINR